MSQVDVTIYIFFFSTYKSNAHIQNEINQTIKRVDNKLRIYKAIKNTIEPFFVDLMIITV